MAESIPKPSLRGRKAQPRQIRRAPAWSVYQEKAADLFLRLGCTAESNALVDGARARHAVDVWVTFGHFGINHRWMVECKFWRMSVTKEKILVAQQVAADVGAEKVFVLSEAGFQSGAIRAAQHTNLMLTSLADLRAVTKGELLSHALDRGEMRLNGLDHRITTLHRESDATSFRPDPGVSPGELTEVMGYAFGLGLNIKKARLDDFPVVVHGGTMAPSVAKSVLEVVDQLEPALIGLEQRVKRLETKSRQGRESKPGLWIGFPQPLRDSCLPGRLPFFQAKPDKVVKSYSWKHSLR